MSRSSISNNTLLQLNSEQGSKLYWIDSCIGQGAHCIVYDAHSVSDSRKVRIKECFPINAGQRSISSDDIIWTDNAQKDKAFSEFRDACSKQIQIQNNVILGNTFAHIVDDICEANQTLYLVVDVNNGVTFDQDETSDIKQILQTIIGLAKVVRNYHRNGYLHLDLKPENFMVIPDTRDLVILLDADTIVRKTAVEHGILKIIPYSKGWAAPEQIQGKWRNISEQTDIYAIGAILFERIMNRCPDNDDIGFYAEWSFPDELSEKHDQDLKKALKEVFKKTITASAKRRYSCLDDLIVALQDALSICDKKKFIIPREVASDIYFVGREQEIEDLHLALTAAKTKAVFLHGFGGIGKTSLAIKYIQRYKEKYDVIHFDRYGEKGLADYIEDIRIHGNLSEVKNDSANQDEEMLRKEKIKLLREVSTQRTLFVIDNFDVDDDSDLEELLSINAKFLFTSRNDHQEICSDQYIQMELNVICTEELLQLFQHEYRQSLNLDEIYTARLIIEEVDNFTMIVPLIARHLRQSEISLTDFYNNLKEEGLSILSDDDEIKHRKDGILTQATLIGHMKQLFKVINLSDKHNKALACIYDLQDLYQLTTEAYKKYTNSRSITAINDLIDWGWIQCEYRHDATTGKDIRHMSLHPIVEEIIGEDLNYAKYHRSVLDYVHGEFATIHNMISISDETAFGDVMALYVSVVELDDDHDEVYDAILDYINLLFANNCLKLKMYLFRAIDFRNDANWEWFIPRIREYQRLKRKDNGLNGVQLTTAMWCMELYETFSYRTNANELTQCYLEGVIKQLQIYIELVQRLIKNTDIAAVDNELDEGVKRFLFPFADSLLKYYLTEPMDLSITKESRKKGLMWQWILTANSSSVFCIASSQIPEAAKLYFMLGKYVYELSELCRISHEDSKAAQYKRTYRNMMIILMYYHGKFCDPYEEETLVPDVYLSQLACNKNQDPADFEIVLQIAANEKKWRKQLGASLWENVICKTNHAVQLYKMILSCSFLLDQPREIQNCLMKNNLAKVIFEDGRLSESEKKELLLYNSYNMIQYISSDLEKAKGYDGSKFYLSKYSTILNIYMFCIRQYDDVIRQEVGSLLNEFRIKYYASLFELAHIKHIRDERLAVLIEAEVTAPNILENHKLLI